MPGEATVPAAVAAMATAASGGGVPSLLLWVTLLVVALTRFAWFCQYMILIRRNLKLGLTMVTSKLYQALDEAERQDVHEKIAAEVNRLVDTSLLVGTLALAAWTALFAFAAQSSSTQISSGSRGLLLVGAGTLISAPLLFRVPDYYLTLIGRRSALFIGLTAVGLAFASIANDVLRGPARIIVPLVIVIILAVRELSDTISEIRLQAVTVGRALAAAKQEAQGAQNPSLQTDP
jgi:hypothetical protein